MLHKNGSAFFFVILFFGLSLQLHAQQSTVSIEVVATFDYPREGATQTVGWAIANTGLSVGDFRLPNNDIVSYERTPNGRFSHPLSFPGAIVTAAQGIDVSGVVCGSMDLASITHGFFYDGQTYTQYDAPSSTFTFIVGENDKGDFVGTAEISENPTAFASLAGVFTTFTVPGAVDTYPSGINNASQIVGSYDDVYGSHGFFRDADGTFTFPIDFPGATDTYLNGINDRGNIVGIWYNNGGGASAFVFQLPNRFTSFEYVGAVSTVFRGINNMGLIAGSYVDSTYINHGLIARVGR